MFDTLASLVGAAQVRTDEDARQRAGSSWYPPRLKASAARIDAVVAPGSADEVAGIIRWAHDTHAQLTATGGGTGVVGGRPAAAGRPLVALDLSRLDRLSWDEESLFVTAGAGVRLADLDERLERHGYTTGHLLGSRQLATVGGAVATNAVGLFSGRYGRVGETILALEAALPDGQIVRTLPAPGARAAFDLHGLFVGAEGAFGIVTEATLAMRPAPDVRAWAVFDFADFGDAADALRLVYRSDARPSVTRLVAPARLFLGFEGDEIVQTGHYQMAYAICQRAGGRARGPEEGDAWLESRGRDDRFAPNVHAGVWADAVAFGAPWSALKGLAAAVRGALAGAAESVAVEVGHAGPHGASVEAAFTVRGGADDYRRLVAAAADAASAADGIVAHHFGVGEKLGGAFAQERGTAEMDLLARLQAALDPNGVFAPLRP